MNFMNYKSLLQRAALIMSVIGAGSVAAQESVDAAPATTIKVELNKLEEANNACRVTLLFENRDAAAYSELKLDLLLFDAAGVVTRRLAVDGAPLRATKTSVKLFEIDGLKCADIGRILLNDVTACKIKDVPSADCIDLIETASRTLITFDK